MVEAILGHRATTALVDMFALLFVFAFFWGMVKASYQRVTGQPVPRKWYTLLLDVVADLAINIPGAVNRIQPGLFWEPGKPRIERVVQSNPGGSNGKSEE